MASDFLLMIFTSVRVLPSISTLSSTTVYTIAMTTPYRDCRRGLNIACITRITRSIAIMVAETGRRNHLFSTSGGISMPPVEAPARMVMPSETPMPKPAKTVLSTRSSVSPPLPMTCSHRARNTGLRMVLATVLRANFRPSTAQPSSSIATLMTNSTEEVRSPLSRVTARAIPVAPPVIKPEGIRNNTTVNAYRALPTRMDRALKTACCL